MRPGECQQGRLHLLRDRSRQETDVLILHVDGYGVGVMLVGGLGHENRGKHVTGRPAQLCRQDGFGVIRLASDRDFEAARQPHSSELSMGQRRRWHRFLLFGPVMTPE